MHRRNMPTDIKQHLLYITTLVFVSVCLAAPFLLSHIVESSLFLIEAPILHKVLFCYSGVAIASLMHSFAGCLSFRRHYGILPTLTDLDFFDYEGALKGAVMPCCIVAYVLFFTLFLCFSESLFSDRLTVNATLSLLL